MNRGVGFTSGVFDLFHIGHLNFLCKARSVCDKLIVGVSTDECVSLYKSLPPVIPFQQRIEIVSCVKFVDESVPQPDLNKMAMWRSTGFDLLILGDDEAQVKNAEPFMHDLKSQGVAIITIPRTPDISTSKIINNIMNRRI